jgi:DNA-binding CsgD family transcriptional regulator
VGSGATKAGGTKATMTRSEALDRGRACLLRSAWNDAYSHLSAALRESPLAAEDLEGLATAAHLTGREAEGADAMARAHREFADRGEVCRAARCAFWLGLVSLFGGAPAQASGWLARGQRLLEGQPDCVERGYLLMPAGIRSAIGGDAEAAYATFQEARAIGERFGDRELVTFALHGQGRALILMGEATRGLVFLDEAMVGVTAGEVGPLIAGIVYCSVIDSCRQTLDLRRAQEWTAALDRWCAAQPDLAPYRGHCLVSRAEILQWRGAWPEALETARQACARLAEPTPKPALGSAFYLMAELHRLRGELDAAEGAYREASRFERAPRPGLAQLRLAQGQTDAAVAAIRRLADEARDPVGRAQVLAAYVEIVLVVKDTPAARTAADELGAIAARHGAAFLLALAGRAEGTVLLAEGDAKRALPCLRDASERWSELEMPHEAARTQVLIGLACRALGDHDAALLELTGAADAFERLGAAADHARVGTLLETRPPRETGPLTGREAEVLRLLASGLTNRELAARLGISEKTVARHVSNIFGKIGVSTRAAATAYAYRHSLA